MYDLVIRGGLVVDGTGAEGRVADVAITDGGEFVHAAPWSTGAQGNSNVSHGCINLSVANATTFFTRTSSGMMIEMPKRSKPTNAPRSASAR